MNNHSTSLTMTCVFHMSNLFEREHTANVRFNLPEEGVRLRRKDEHIFAVVLWWGPQNSHLVTRRLAVTWVSTAGEALLQCFIFTFVKMDWENTFLHIHGPIVSLIEIISSLRKEHYVVVSQECSSEESFCNLLLPSAQKIMLHNLLLTKTLLWNWK